MEGNHVFLSLVEAHAGPHGRVHPNPQGAVNADTCCREGGRGSGFPNSFRGSRSRDHTWRNRDVRGVSSELPECELHGDLFWFSDVSPRAESRTRALSATGAETLQTGVPPAGGPRTLGFYRHSTPDAHPPRQAVASPRSLGRVTILGPPFLGPDVQPAQPGPGPGLP